MKKLLTFSLLLLTVIFGLSSCAEDKSKRLSAPATAFDSIAGGNTITINYSRPSLKGRTIGRDIAKFDSVWQTGDNEATTFEITKDAKIEGKRLPKGKYSLYTIPGKKTWIIIFNKTWDQWGMEYKQTDDVLRVQVTPQEAPEFFEQMKFVIERDGRVLLFWGETVVAFKVE